MADDIGLTAVLVLGIFFIVWFFAGGIWNRRLARRLANEMKDAILALGGTSEIRWVGSTAFQISTEGADPPYREVSVVVALKPREMPINWALGVASGRTDLAVLEASLRTAPRMEFEIVDPRTPVGRRRARMATGFSPVRLGEREMLLKSDRATDALEFLGSHGGGALRGVSALHVVAGKEPRVAASLALVPGEVSARIAIATDLARALSNQ